MQTYRHRFIDFMLQSRILTFGDFTTKSGRKTPYFINTGAYSTGEQMQKLGEFYADAIADTLGMEFDVLFGPAYKGIPLAVATSMALATRHQKNCGICFNRKEAKDHGEGGTLIGHKLKDGDRVLIIEDVTTAGTSIRESVPLLQAAARVTIAGLIVSVDRMERGSTPRSALQEIRSTYGFPTSAIVSLDDIIAYLTTTPVNGSLLIDADLKARIDTYRQTYGAA